MFIKRFVVIFSLFMFFLAGMSGMVFFYEKSKTMEVLRSNEVLRIRFEAITIKSDFDAILSDVSLAGDYLTQDIFSESSEKNDLNKHLKFLCGNKKYSKITIANLMSFDCQKKIAGDLSESEKKYASSSENKVDYFGKEIYIDFFSAQSEKIDGNFFSQMIRLGIRAGKEKNYVFFDYPSDNLLRNIDSRMIKPKRIIMLFGNDNFLIKGITQQSQNFILSANNNNFIFIESFPDVWSKIWSEKNGQITNESGFFTFESIDGLNMDFRLVSHVANQELMFSLKNNIFKFLALFAVLVVLFAAISWILAKTIEGKKEAERKIVYDDLTGLPNKVLLGDRLRNAINRSRRNNNIFGVFFLDIDNFKNINENLGHNFGDKLIQLAAERIKNLLRSGDTMTRWGGGGFVIVAEEAKVKEKISSLAQRIVNSFETPFVLDDKMKTEIYISISIGISIFPADINNQTLSALDKVVGEVIRNAEIALHKAKEECKGYYKFYSEYLKAENIKKMNTESQLRQAIKNNGLVLHYQSQVDVRRGRIVGAEVLVRMRSTETNKLIAPSEFISIAEESGLILALGEWVLKSAAQQAKHWSDAGNPIKISVNISGYQFKRGDLVRSVKNILQKTGLEPALLELELTEGYLISDIRSAVSVVKELKKIGVSISIDDFGTGYSSLRYLAEFPINAIKIDKSFIAEIPNEKNIMIIKAIIHMAKGIGLETIAEGVETKKQLEFLDEQGCKIIQGYFYSKPLPKEKFEEFYNEFNNNPRTLK